MNNIRERGYLLTEQINPKSKNLDQLTSIELVDLFNEEDINTIEAINKARLELAKSIEVISQALKDGGKLFYIGAGTSGRLGVLDAVECPPTFCTSPELVQGIIAGGNSSLTRSSEDLEDSFQDGEKEILQKEITDKDVVIGISAGGTTPFVHGALNAARKKLSTTIAISCVPIEQVPISVDINIRLLTGPEILAGSTRLKAGTATKMALNIISTGVMVKLGKVYENRMIDVAITNLKLYDRALRILQELTNLSRQDAILLLEDSNKQVKLALLRYWTGITSKDGQSLLDLYQGNLKSALSYFNKLKINE
ncbi:N-acetylmuramic acid 6-phosphate etherase [Candidatus Atelocyanobacterium thalassae]|uniref:N-acetylmuramic acid 6-phosphate etherase n=1 Tax=cyanobacterium endosymbiont of Braarudosphaera bigelowii TaxID=1285375 RepID=A0ABM7UC21_9CHRO|nr:N-acetylmuramic acid 6-phosphate etherase [Candidatus Atelocyanobacterium thalassa]BDA39450.1 N-acetylmuramic acid 6-phosphate etherase [cyanobacterium endosymbiont of Braarudosphaera bigelowii]